MKRIDIIIINPINTFMGQEIREAEQKRIVVYLIYFSIGKGKEA